MTSDDDRPSTTFETALGDNWGTYGLGEIEDELPEEYVHTKVDLEYLQTLIDTAEVLGWSTVTVSLLSEAPIFIRNHDADDKPTLAVAPIVGQDLEDDE